MSFIAASGLDPLQFLLAVFGGILFVLFAIHIFDYQLGKRKPFMTASLEAGTKTHKRTPGRRALSDTKGSVARARRHPQAKLRQSSPRPTRPSRATRPSGRKSATRARPLRAKEPAAAGRGTPRKYVIRLMTVSDAAAGQQRLAALSARHPAVLKRFKSSVRRAPNTPRRQGFDLCVGPIGNLALASEAYRALKGAGLTESQLRVAASGPALC